MVKYRFFDFVYEEPYSPYYNKYHGHEFVIDHYSTEDREHVWLKCISDPTIIVAGYVELYQLEEIDEK